MRYRLTEGLGRDSRGCSALLTDDHAAAEAYIFVVEHEILPGRRRPLRDIEVSAKRIAVGANLAARVGHPVPCLRRKACRQRRRSAGDPVHLGRFDVAPIQTRIVTSLNDYQRIARE